MLSAEHRKKISDTVKAYWTEENRAKAREISKSYWTEENRAKASARKNEFYATPEGRKVREKMSKAHTGITAALNKRYTELVVNLESFGYKKSLYDFYVTKTGNVIRVREQAGVKYYTKIKPTKTKDGYMQVSCPAYGGGIHVHTLVAHSWIGPKPEGMEIDHIDKNKENNYFENLRYVTRKENMENAHKADTHEYKGRYIWRKEEFVRADGIRIKMTKQEYYDYLVERSGKGIANKIFKQHKERTAI